MEGTVATAFVIGVGVPIMIHRHLFAAVMKKLSALGMLRINYLGKEVVTAGGVMMIISTIVSLAVLLPFFKAQGVADNLLKEGFLLGTGMLTMAFLGWKDDCAADKEMKGFRGHLGTWWREKRMTSGMWKAWGGGSTAILISLAITDSAWTWLLAAGLLALSPNVINLFDLRPTRAIKVFWLLLAAGIVSVIGGGTGKGTSSLYAGLWLLPVISSTVLLFRHDGGGRIMLGDTGANALGFTAGYFLVLVMPAQAQAVMLGLFVTLHIAAEFVSFTRIIQKVRWLAVLDEWGRSAER